MDYDEIQNAEPTPPQPQSPPPQPQPVYIPVPEKRKKSSGWRIFWGVVIGMSIIANVFLFLMIIGIVGMFITGPGELFDSQNGFVEETLVKGSATEKIVVIRLEGIIDSIQSRRFTKQLKAAKKDPNVKAVIVRTITPGGTVSGSDQIHNQISRFRAETGKPVVAFMQTVAASGGYYSSVACDKIVAEPTVITGSIGVIMSNLVFKDLLEQKLGIEPVVLKSGEKKDWPSMFREMDEEQKQYLMDKLINPAYERFVKLVAEGRKDVLSPEEVRKLSDGSIYGAEEAKENKLIDEVGYIEKAISVTQGLADIKGARVVEYQRMFSLSTLLGAETKHKKLIEADRNTLHELAVPQLMYLWDIRW